MNQWALWKRWTGASRPLLLACCLALLGFCWIRMWVITQIETSSLEVILEQVWDKYERFSPVPFSHLLTYHGRVALAYNEPLIMIFISVWAIARGSETVSGHVHSGVMEMLLAQPVSRRTVMFSQSAITIIGLVLLSACVWIGISTGIETLQVKEEHRPSITIPAFDVDIPLPFAPVTHEVLPMAMKTSPEYFVYPTINLFCVGVLIAGFTTLASALDRYRWRTIGIVIGFVTVQMVISIISLWSESLGWMRYLTFFSAYQPEIIVSIAVTNPHSIWAIALENRQGMLRPGPLGYDLILLVPGVLCYLLAGVVFCRRDLPAPL